jgi:putative hydrolase of the HAD superfamily
MARKRIPALIFDFGNVVAHFDYRQACTTLGRPLGISGEAFLERVRGLGFSPLVKDYESGRMTAEEFSSKVCGLAGLEIAHDEFAQAWADIFQLNEPVAGVIVALKRSGYTLVLGSNTNDLHAAQFRRQFATTLEHFDRLVLSYEVGHIKPSAAFYEACALAAGVPAGECLFIDDLLENVAGARAAGMDALVFRDVEGLRRDLSARGIEVDGAER